MNFLEELSTLTLTTLPEPINSKKLTEMTEKEKDQEREREKEIENIRKNAFENFEILKRKFSTRNYKEASEQLTNFKKDCLELSKYDSADNIDKMNEYIKSYDHMVVSLCVEKDDSEFLVSKLENMFKIIPNEAISYMKIAIEKESELCVKELLKFIKTFFPHILVEKIMKECILYAIDLENKCLEQFVNYMKNNECNNSEIINYAIENSKMIAIKLICSSISFGKNTFSPINLKSNILCDLNINKYKYNYSRCGYIITNYLLNLAKIKVHEKTITEISHCLFPENHEIILQVVEHKKFVKVISGNYLLTYKGILDNHKELFSYLTSQNYDYFEKLKFQFYPFNTIMRVVEYCIKRQIVKINVPVEDDEKEEIIEFNNIIKSNLKIIIAFLRNEGISSIEVDEDESYLISYASKSFKF